MTLNEKELEKLTQLCHIECTEEEKKKLRSNLSDILSYIDQLQKVNTDGIPPCSHVLESSNIWREDEIGETLPRDLFLSNAPSQIGGMIKIPSNAEF